MSKPLTVRQMRNRFQKLIDQGYGDIPVLSQTHNTTEPKIKDGKLRYTGPSEWDSRTYSIDTRGEGKVVIV